MFGSETTTCNELGKFAVWTLAIPPAWLISDRPAVRKHILHSQRPHKRTERLAPESKVRVEFGSSVGSIYIFLTCGTMELAKLIAPNGPWGKAVNLGRLPT